MSEWVSNESLALGLCNPMHRVPPANPGPGAAPVELNSRNSGSYCEAMTKPADPWKGFMDSACSMRRTQLAERGCKGGDDS